MARVLICGGTGGIGTHLCEHLSKNGIEPSLLSRSGSSSNSKYPTYLCDPENGRFEPEALESCEYLINLAGAGIADKRWTRDRKKLLYDSRVGTTEFLFDQIKLYKPPIKCYVAASATGYYGQQTMKDKIFTEKDPHGNDFVGQLCKDWEEAALGFEKLGFRTVRLRIGIVLMKDSGALVKMASPVKMGVGAPLGSGKQFIPWIHIDDLVNIIKMAMDDNRYEGALNSCAPEAVDNKDFTKALGLTLKKNILPVPVPGLLLRMALGDRAALMLEGSRVHPEALLKLGYAFKFPKLEPALRDILHD